MKKELNSFLQDIKSNPLPGGSHDAKMAIVKVEELFAIDELSKEVVALKSSLAEYNQATKTESRRMRNLTIALGVVAILQLLIAYGQLRLGESQIDSSQAQVQLENSIWEYEKMRDNRLEERDVEWRREDLESQGRAP